MKKTTAYLTMIMVFTSAATFAGSRDSIQAALLNTDSVVKVADGKINARQINLGLRIMEFKDPAFRQ